jgi:hypothetical protein
MSAEDYALLALSLLAFAYLIFALFRGEEL